MLSMQSSVFTKQRLLMHLMLSHAEQWISLAVAFGAIDVPTCRAVDFPSNGF